MREWDEEISQLLSKLNLEPAHEAAIVKEISQHLDDCYQESLANGATPSEAERRTLNELGAVETLQRELRRVERPSPPEPIVLGTNRRINMIADFWQDLRYGARMAMKNRGFTAVAVFTLALGISANITIFSMISEFFFNPLPVKDPDQLVLVLQKSAVWDKPHGHSWLDFRDYRERLNVFSDMLAVAMSPAHLSVAGQQPDREWIEIVSGNYFSMLGVEPKLGRLFHREEGEKPGADPIVVLSYEYWQRKFGADPAVVGKAININGHPFTVVGVAPETFSSAQWKMAPRAFVPASMAPQAHPDGEASLKERGEVIFRVMARLKPGVTIAQAGAAVEIAGRQLAREYPDEHKGAKVFVAREQYCRPEPTTSEFIPLAAAVFMAMVGLVLLIACANVANLMLSRSVARQKEMGIRTAIGANRWRLIRQLLAESVLLACLAGVAGSLLANWSGYLLNKMPNGAGDMPLRADEASWDWRVFAFTLALSLLVGVVTGLAPALRATRFDLQSVLKEGGGLLASRRHFFRSALVISQVAVSVVVLIAGGLFVRSLQQVADSKLGFRSDHLLLASIDLGLQGYDEARQKQFHRQLLDRLNALPGVRSASLARIVPFGYDFQVAMVAPEEKAGDKDSFTTAHANYVTPEYLTTMGVPVLKGRDFTQFDSENSTKVAIINATMAERLWPGQDALGRRFKSGAESDFWQVVGVARNAKYVMIGEEPRPFFYAPLAQHHVSPVTLNLWSDVAPAALTSAVRDVIRQMDADLPIYNVRTMEEHLNDSAFAMLGLRYGAVLAGAQGLLGLLLAAMGLYGVVSYVVSQRTREIGVRVALGARNFDILRLVVRDGLRLTLIGLAIGLFVSLGFAAIITKLLYGMAPAATPVFVAVVVLLASVALLACYLPARRAMKVDPMVALRCE
ncbi:MAG TPA: ABC transporter permease [Blastocatellia bacterium]|nr:ABC transporter permease [Blastocatellia bacterium]